MAGVNAARLRQVREANGLSPAHAAEKVGVSRQSIYGYETGRQEPRPAVIERFAELYGVSLDLLSRTPTEIDGVVFYRSLASVTQTARRRVERQVEWMLEVYDHLDRHIEMPEFELPRFQARDVEECRNPNFVENLAADLRRQWKLGDGPIHDVLGLLENMGIIFTRMPLHEARLDAFSFYSASRSRAFAVLGTDKCAAVRVRGNALHESFHLMTHAHMDDIPRTFQKDRELRNAVEKPAMRFPLAFLFPEPAFREEVRPSASLDDLLRLKLRWGVSAQAMVVRASPSQLGVFDEQKTAQLFRQINYRGWRQREPFDDELKLEEPTLLREAFKAFVEAEPHRAANLFMEVGLGDEDIERVCDLPIGFVANSRKRSPRVRIRATPKGGNPD